MNMARHICEHIKKARIKQAVRAPKVTNVHTGKKTIDVVPDPSHS
ncbi:hypothetical protein MAE02_65520 [Microvirga aerophila]|uniref:Uncharacterized protein n=1 Tax=Microvirga aerophila TaxID=670291 RepID=A0A512C3R7_9HYPH|nr:hypothetical protein MAE02_65520 [Microvirga aerophila]